MNDFFLRRLSFPFPKRFFFTLPISLAQALSVIISFSSDSKRMERESTEAKVCRGAKRLHTRMNFNTGHLLPYSYSVLPFSLSPPVKAHVTSLCVGEIFLTASLNLLPLARPSSLLPSALILLCFLLFHLFSSQVSYYLFHLLLLFSPSTFALFLCCWLNLLSSPFFFSSPHQTAFPIFL